MCIWLFARTLWQWADPDLQIKGEGVRGGGGGRGVSKKIFSAPRASAWCKNKGRPSPGSATAWLKPHVIWSRDQQDIVSGTSVSPTWPCWSSWPTRLQQVSLRNMNTQSVVNIELLNGFHVVDSRLQVLDFQIPRQWNLDSEIQSRGFPFPQTIISGILRF